VSRRDRTRRQLLLSGVGLAGLGLAVPAVMAAAAIAEDDLQAKLLALQARSGGRLGVYGLNTGTRATVAFQAEQRFAMASTFKLLLAAAVLARVDTGQLSLERMIRYGERDMVPHAPVTSAHLINGRGILSVGDLCAAAVTVSDNPAANLLLPLVGGPPGLTRFLRELGDGQTRLDRIEPALNSNLPGDERDTSTPQAFVGSMEALLLGAALSREASELLLGWMVETSTGLQRLRGGIPAEWQAGDKTGTGGNGAVNDVAVLWQQGKAPLLMAVFMSGASQSMESLNKIHQDAAALLLKALV